MQIFEIAEEYEIADQSLTLTGRGRTPIGPSLPKLPSTIFKMQRRDTTAGNERRISDNCATDAAKSINIFGRLEADIRASKCRLRKVEERKVRIQYFPLTGRGRGGGI